MSYATVRTACKTYLDAPAVPGLLKVHRAKPRNWKANEIKFNAVTPSSAAGFIHIEGAPELRVGTSKKHTIYTVALVLVFRTSRTDAEAAVDDFDTLIEAIKAKLRVKPPVLGGIADPAIYDAAEGMLEVATDLPPDTALVGETWARVRFDVKEMITA